MVGSLFPIYSAFGSEDPGVTNHPNPRTFLHHTRYAPLLYVMLLLHVNMRDICQNYRRVYQRALTRALDICRPSFDRGNYAR